MKKFIYKQIQGCIFYTKLIFFPPTKAKRGTLVYRFLRNLGTAQALVHLEIWFFECKLIFDRSTHNFWSF